MTHDGISCYGSTLNCLILNTGKVLICILVVFVWKPPLPSLSEMPVNGRGSVTLPASLMVSCSLLAWHRWKRLRPTGVTLFGWRFSVILWPVGVGRDTQASAGVDLCHVCMLLGEETAHIVLYNMDTKLHCYLCHTFVFPLRNTNTFMPP